VSGAEQGDLLEAHVEARGHDDDDDDDDDDILCARSAVDSIQL
jgi:hypothetical protein